MYENRMHTKYSRSTVIGDHILPYTSTVHVPVKLQDLRQLSSIAKSPIARKQIRETPRARAVLHVHMEPICSFLFLLLLP